MRLVLVVVLFLFSIVISKAASCSICGVYINELESVLNITSTKNGFLYGNYASKVGKAAGSFKVVGSYNSDDLPTSIGWVVSWNNNLQKGYSTTSWTGILMQNNQQTIILTQWHLSIVSSYQNYWNSTLSGSDSFILVN